jgi:hypothetical protein
MDRSGFVNGLILEMGNDTQQPLLGIPDKCPSAEPCIKRLTKSHFGSLQMKRFKATAAGVLRENHNLNTFGDECFKASRLWLSNGCVFHGLLPRWFCTLF